MTQKRSTSILIIAGAALLGAALALAGSQHGLSVGGIPAFALAIAIAFVVQWVAYIPAAIAQTDRFFDATGSITYISVTVALLALSPERDARSLILGALVIFWAARLGSFLLVRNLRTGGDDRFAAIRVAPLRFLSVWTIQGLWVSLTAAAAWIAISSAESAPLGWSAWVGVAVWLIGFAIEVTADLQKSRFKKNPANSGKFISTGLWSVVRHPNYLGEILLWIGVLIVAAPVLQGWQWVALLSPLFVIVLLTRVSGIPLLEAKAERTWGEDPEYREYRAKTPALIPGLRNS
ncbi:DUF1295 domain-containing protein [Leucobacter komagatae]|uniref:Membrane protein n=1 Tax=Leucobacter komagatae TaxID=55969 RepID=A0A0D0IKM7_9MICO|nr:DUF1295 domain-containing protein [Leucobacter komagatae]KIP51657.1 membrane protein [Leucobacter komagatae]